MWRVAKSFRKLDTSLPETQACKYNFPSSLPVVIIKMFGPGRPTCLVHSKKNVFILRTIDYQSMFFLSSKNHQPALIMFALCKKEIWGADWETQGGTWLKYHRSFIYCEMWNKNVWSTCMRENELIKLFYSLSFSHPYHSAPSIWVTFNSHLWFRYLNDRTTSSCNEFIAIN